MAGFAAASLGGRVTDISHAVESYVRSQGDYGIVEDYVGHGIGSAMHQPPNVPNFGRPGKGPKLVEASRSRSSRWWCSATGPPTCSATTGRSRPTTARSPPTSSTRSR